MEVTERIENEPEDDREVKQEHDEIMAIESEERESDEENSREGHEDIAEEENSQSNYNKCG